MNIGENGAGAPASQRNGQKKPTALKRVFDLSVEDTITDDQIDNILAPVLVGIREGRFEKRRRKRLIAWLAGPLPIMAAVAAIIVVTMNANNDTMQNVVLDIPDAEVPMAQSADPASAAGANKISGRVYFTGQDPGDGGAPTDGLGGVVIQLIRAESGEAYSWTVTGEDGTFILRGFPDGVYQLRAVLPSNEGVEFAPEILSDGDSQQSTVIAALMINGVIDQVFDMDGQKTLEGVDIPVCRVK